MSTTMLYDVSSVFPMARQTPMSDVGIRCLECGHILDEEYVTDGFEELFHDDADIDRDVCVTDGAVEL